MHRSSTWGSPLEVDRVDEKNQLYPSKTVPLPIVVVSQYGNDHLTREEEKQELQDIENLGENQDCEANKVPASRGYFEDKELVNVVQNLVTSRYCSFQ